MSPLDQQLFFGFNSCLEYDAVIYQEKKNEEICQCNGEKMQAMNLGLLSTHFKRIIAKWKKNEASTYPCYIGNEIVTCRFISEYVLLSYGSQGLKSDHLALWQHPKIHLGLPSHLSCH